MATKTLKTTIAERMAIAEQHVTEKAQLDLSNAPIQTPTRKTPSVQVIARQRKDTTTTVGVRVDNKVQKALKTLNGENGNYAGLLNFLVARGIQSVLAEMQKTGVTEFYATFTDDSVAGVRDKLLNELVNE